MHPVGARLAHRRDIVVDDQRHVGRQRRLDGTRERDHLAGVVGFVAQLHDGGAAGGDTAGEVGQRVASRRLRIDDGVEPQIDGELLLRIDDLPGDTLTIILGDLNEWWRPLRSLVALYGFGGDHVRSFPTQWPILALDHVLVRPARAVEKTHAHDSPLARVASDHLPVRAVVAPQ